MYVLHTAMRAQAPLVGRGADSGGRHTHRAVHAVVAVAGADGSAPNSAGRAVLPLIMIGFGGRGMRIHVIKFPKFLRRIIGWITHK